MMEVAGEWRLDGEGDEVAFECQCERGRAWLAGTVRDDVAEAWH